MGKLKALGWFFLIAFILYAFGVWFVDQPEGAASVVGSLVEGLGKARDALGIFFDELFK
jgi:hypothetical protein